MHRLILKRKDQPYFQKGYEVIYPKDSNPNTISYSDAMPFVLPFYFHDINNIKKYSAIEAGVFSDKAAKYTQISNFGVENLLPDLNNISVPTLIIVGDDEIICDKISQADRISKEIANSTEIVIKDAGHFSWIEQPKQFFSETKKWLKKQGLKEHK